MIRIDNNPYNGNGAWLKGNLHAHTTNSDGALSPQRVVDLYADLGYDFLMISDHDFVTDVDALDSRGMVLIPGNEVTMFGPHMLHVGAPRAVAPDSNRQRVLDGIESAGGFAIMNHPNWERHFEHCPQERLEAWSGYAGIEIYNGVVRRQEGSPTATDRWDRLLGSGRRVWGFADDDWHASGDEGVAWNMALCERRDRTGVLAALRTGRFYASTGVEITSIEADERRVVVRTSNAQRIVAHSDFGHREGTVDGNSMEFELPSVGTMRYVRFECWGPGEAMAWTQPFWVSSP